MSTKSPLLITLDMTGSTDGKVPADINRVFVVATEAACSNCQDKYCHCHQCSKYGVYRGHNHIVLNNVDNLITPYQ